MLQDLILHLESHEFCIPIPFVTLMSSTTEDCSESREDSLLAYCFLVLNSKVNYIEASKYSI